jgi:general secretion pathway protein N
MKRFWSLLALGLGAFLLFAVVTLPASLLISRLDEFGVHAAGVEGTVWKGRAQVLQVANSNLGSVSWNLHVLPLFAARLQADLQLNRSDGFARSTVAVASSGRMHFSQLNASLPLSALPTGSLLDGWTGSVNLDLAELVVENGWPIAAEGTVDVLDLKLLMKSLYDIGSYQLVFADAAESAPGNGLIAAITDLGGQLQVSGTLQLKPDRSYEIAGLVATRPETPRQVADSLQILGEPDAQGRRPFSVEGTM